MLAPAANKPIKNVVFDMGGVLMNFDGPYFASLFTDTPEDAALLNQALFGSTMWSLLDSGTITHETMRRYAAHHPSTPTWTSASSTGPSTPSPSRRPTTSPSASSPRATASTCSPTPTPTS